MLVSWSIIPLSIVIRCYKMYYRATGWGKTPLHYAARDGLVACVEVLLKAGAKTDIEDHRGSAPQNSFASNSLVKNEETFLIFSSSSFCIWRSEFSWVSLSNCVKKSDVAFSFFVLHQQVILSFVFEFVHLLSDFMRFLYFRYVPTRLNDLLNYFSTSGACQLDLMNFGLVRMWTSVTRSFLYGNFLWLSSQWFQVSWDECTALFLFS